MKDNIVLDRLMESPKIKRAGVKREIIEAIIDLYNDTVLRTLLEKGHVDAGNGMLVEVVQLLDRVHVLRGVSYRNSRKYKLKLTMDDNLYNRIEDYYDSLLEDIK